MRSALLRSCRVQVPVFAGAAALLCAASADAAVRIEFTGMNMVYDGSSLYDAGSLIGGVANPADADPLVTVDCFTDNTLVGSLYSDIYLDFFIPDITNISSAPNTTQTISVTPAISFFDLLIGSSPVASQYLILDIQTVSVTYIDIAGIAQFTFAGAVASAFAQNLPFGLQVADPVTVSLSAQVIPGTLTSGGGFITGFQGFGTGEFNANAVPAPGAAALLGMGALAMPRRRRSAR